MVTHWLRVQVGVVCRFGVVTHWYERVVCSRRLAIGLSMVTRAGCRFFIYGTGADVGTAGRCYWEQTKNAACPEGWETDFYDFYEVNTGELG